MKTNTRQPKSHDLTAAQVSATVERSSLGREEFAERVGCGTSQLFKYQKEGLPPRMNRQVRAKLLHEAMNAGVLPQSAALRAEIDKLSKGSSLQ